MASSLIFTNQDPTTVRVPIDGKTTLVVDDTSIPNIIRSDGTIVQLAEVGSTGTVTSVALSLPNIFSVSGSPVTSNGTLTAILSEQTGNTFFAAPIGSTAIPSFRAIDPSDVPVLNQNTTGNAGTATTLQTPRDINGVAFDGSANITVSAAAGTLTGTSLAVSIVSSSLTTVGTLSSLTVTAPIVGSIAGNAATVTTNANLTGPITSVGNATTVVNNAITNAMLAQSGALTLKGNNTGSLADVSDISISSISLSEFGAPTGNISAGGFQIVGAAQATSSTALPTLAQVQTLIASGVHFYLDVQAAVGTNVDISSAPSTYDGYSAVSGDRIELFGQTTGSQNGVWVFNSVGTALTRPIDYASGSTQRAGLIVVVGDGSTYAGYSFFLQTDNVTVDTTVTTWVASPSVLGYVGDVPIHISGNQISLNIGTGLTTNSGNLVVSYGTSAGTALQGNQAAGGDATGTLDNLTIAKSGGVSFGTAAFQNIGTSGSNLPFLNGVNVWSGVQTANLNLTSLPTAQTGTVLRLANADTVATRLELNSFGAASFFTAIAYSGTAAAPTALVNNQQIGGYNSWGYNGTSVVGPVASFRTYAAENWSVGHQGSYADIVTTAIGSTTAVEVIRFENDGGITVPSTVTGGSKGVGSINANGLYVSGVTIGSSAFLNVATTTQDTWYDYAAWGDSLTAGNQDLSGVSYPIVLQGTLAQTVYNGGNPGDTSTQIATRFAAAPQLWGFYTIILSGRNNYSALSTVVSDIAGMVASLPNPNRLLVLSVFNADLPTEYVGQTNYNEIISLNSALAAAYPSNYLNARSALIALYNPANAQDVIDQANDVIPSSLRAIDIAGTSGVINPSDTSFTLNYTENVIEVGQTIIIGSEKIYLTGVTSPSTVTSCTRGYAGTTAAGYGSGTAFTGIDILHLSAAGYSALAGIIDTWLQSNTVAVTSETVSVSGLSAVFASPANIGSAIPNNGTFTSLISSSMAIKGSTSNNGSSINGGLSIFGNNLSPAWTSNGLLIRVANANLTDTTSTGTVSFNYASVIGQPTLSAINSNVTYSNTATLQIAGVPLAGTNVTLPISVGLFISGASANSAVARGLQVTAPSGGSTSQSVAGIFTYGITGKASSLTTPVGLDVHAGTFTDGSTASSGTASGFTAMLVGQPKLAAQNTAVTTTIAASVYVNGPPTTGTNQSIGSSYGLYVGSNTVSSSVTTAYAARFDAPTGATTNYAAYFTGLTYVSGALTAIGSVTFTGGTIDGTVIGGTTPATGSFTALTASGTVNINVNASTNLTSIGTGTTSGTVTIGTLTNLVNLGSATISIGASVTTTGVGLNINGSAGQSKQFTFQSAGVNRWQCFSDSTAESGSNVGSNYNLRAVGDTGTTIDSPITIVRVAGGTMALSRPITMASTLAVSGLTSTNLGLTSIGAAVNLNVSSNFGTNINTGTSNGAVIIGNTSSTLTVNSTATFNSSVAITGAAQVFSGNQSRTAWGVSGILIRISTGSTLTDTSTSGTIASNYVSSIAPATLAASNTSTIYTTAATLAITGAPVAGTNVTLTNAYSLLVTSGLVVLQGGLNVTGAASSINTSSNFTTNINTGTSTGAVTIGNSANTVLIQAPFSTNLGRIDAGVVYQTFASAGSYTLTTARKTINTATATIATFTLTTPAAPVDGQECFLESPFAITALTISANSGQSTSGAPTTLAASSSLKFSYRASNTTWYIT